MIREIINVFIIFSENPYHLQACVAPATSNASWRGVGGFVPETGHGYGRERGTYVIPWLAGHDILLSSPLQMLCAIFTKTCGTP